MLLQSLILCSSSIEFMIIFISLIVFTPNNTLIWLYSIFILISSGCIIRCGFNEVSNHERNWKIVTLYWLGAIFAIVGSIIGNIIFWTQYEQLMESLVIYTFMIANNAVWALLFCIPTTDIFKDFFGKKYLYWISSSYFFAQTIINIRFAYKDNLEVVLAVFFMISICAIINYVISSNVIIESNPPNESNKEFCFFLKETTTFCFNIIAISSILSNRIIHNSFKSQIYTFTVVFNIINFCEVIKKIIYGVNYLHEIIERIKYNFDLIYKILKLLLTLISIHLAIYYDSLIENIVFLTNTIVFMLIISLGMLFLRYRQFNHDEKVVVMTPFVLTFIALDIYSIILLCNYEVINEINILIITINVLIGTLIVILMTYSLIKCADHDCFVSTFNVIYYLFCFAGIDALVGFFTSKKVKKYIFLFKILASLSIFIVIFLISFPSVKEMIFYYSLIFSLILCLLISIAVTKNTKKIKFLCGVLIILTTTCFVMNNLIFGHQIIEPNLKINFIFVFSIIEYVLVTIGFIIGLLRITRNVKIIGFWFTCSLLIIHLVLLGACPTTEKLLISYYTSAAILFYKLLEWIAYFISFGNPVVSPTQNQENYIELNGITVENEKKSESGDNKENILTNTKDDILIDESAGELINNNIRSDLYDDSKIKTDISGILSETGNITNNQTITSNVASDTSNSNMDDQLQNLNDECKNFIESIKIISLTNIVIGLSLAIFSFEYKYNNCRNLTNPLYAISLIPAGLFVLCSIYSIIVIIVFLCGPFNLEIVRNDATTNIMTEEKTHI